jgi:preprotein translocase subunit SecE
MNAQVNSSNNAFDWFKWIVVVALVAATVYGNFYFAEQSLIVRVVVVLVVLAIALGVAVTTVKGRSVNRLRKEAWVEVRKVVWPTRQETVQTTMVVIGFVLVVALILWGVDTVLGLSVKAIVER